MDEQAVSKEQRKGLLVFLFLVVLTGVEYFVSVSMSNPNALLTILAFGKALLIVIYFMHIAQLWGERKH